MVAPHEPTSKACELTCSPIRVRPRRELKHRHGSQGQVRCTGSVVVLTRQRRLPFLRVLPTLVEDLLDIVGRSYDGIDYVVLHDIHEAMLDPGESNHPLAALGVVAQTPRDTRLAEVDVAVTAKLKARRVVHNPMKPL